MIYAEIFGVVLFLGGVVLLYKRDNVYRYMVKKPDNEILFLKKMIFNFGTGLLFIGAGTSVPIFLKSLGYDGAAYIFMIVAFLALAAVTLWPGKKNPGKTPGQ